MDETYLPGGTRERILDLIKERKLTQKELAARIGETESALSRFLSGASDRLDSEALLRIARFFGVSADFLLGETAVPDRKNYEIVELGLSVQEGCIGLLHAIPVFDSTLEMKFLTFARNSARSKPRS